MALDHFDIENILRIFICQNKTEVLKESITWLNKYNMQAFSDLDKQNISASIHEMAEPKIWNNPKVCIVHTLIFQLRKQSSNEEKRFLKATDKISKPRSKAQIHQLLVLWTHFFQGYEKVWFLHYKIFVCLRIRRSTLLTHGRDLKAILLKRS